MKLSILIPTIPDRKYELRDLLSNLRPQCEEYPNDVEIILDSRVDINIGKKRNELLQKASGDYIVFIDDDDHISDKYVDIILHAIEFNTDCIGISGKITTNGKNERKWHISKEFKHWHEKNNVYYRTPNHISPVRRELALKAAFPEIAHGEDFEYSKRLLPLLKTEVRIPGEIYHYDFNSRK